MDILQRAQRILVCKILRIHGKAVTAFPETSADRYRMALVCEHCGEELFV